MHSKTIDTIRHSAQLLKSNASQALESLMIVRETLKHLPINFFYFNQMGYIHQCNTEMNNYFGDNFSAVGKHYTELNVEDAWQNSVKVMDYKQTIIFDEEYINNEKKLFKFLTVKFPIYDGEKKNYWSFRY